MSDDKILNWKDEAEAIIQDVKDHVNHISVSKKLKNNASHIYLNLRTLENSEFCILASGSGFQIVGEEFDKAVQRTMMCDDEEEFFETPYALLNHISPSYTKSFANQLMKQLEKLQELE